MIVCLWFSRYLKKKKKNNNYQVSSKKFTVFCLGEGCESVSFKPSKL